MDGPSRIKHASAWFWSTEAGELNARYQADSGIYGNPACRHWMREERDDTQVCAGKNRAPVSGAVRWQAAATL